MDAVNGVSVLPDTKPAKPDLSRLVVKVPGNTICETWTSICPVTP